MATPEAARAELARLEGVARHWLDHAQASYRRIALDRGADPARPDGHDDLGRPFFRDKFGDPIPMPTIEVSPDAFLPALTPGEQVLQHERELRAMVSRSNERVKAAKSPPRDPAAEAIAEGWRKREAATSLLGAWTGGESREFRRKAAAR